MQGGRIGIVVLLSALAAACVPAKRSLLDTTEAPGLALALQMKAALAYRKLACGEMTPYVFWNQSAIQSTARGFSNLLSFQVNNDLSSLLSGCTPGKATDGNTVGTFEYHENGLVRRGVLKTPTSETTVQVFVNADGHFVRTERQCPAAVAAGRTLVLGVEYTGLNEGIRSSIFWPAGCLTGADVTVDIRIELEYPDGASSRAVNFVTPSGTQRRTDKVDDRGRVLARSETCDKLSPPICEFSGTRDYAISYNEINQVTQRTRTGTSTEAYSYDSRGRLVQIIGHAQPTVFEYSGDRLTRFFDGSSNRSFTFE